MAASVRIEAVAFSDPRIELLGQIAGYNRFEAMGRLAHLWSACTERETDILPAAFIRGALGKNGVEALIESGLGEAKNGECRVRGCEGRINWLASKRRASRLGGEANKRKSEAKVEPEGSQKGAESMPNDIPLTLTPTLALGIENTDSCSEVAKQPSEPPVMIFPCVGKDVREWPLVQSKIDEYRESFPGINVEAECRKARQWCIDNPTKRKTFKGMPKFLSGWMGRAQDNLRLSPRNSADPPKQREQLMTDEEIAEFARKAREAAQ